MAILPVSDVIAATVKGHFSLEKASDAVNTNDPRLIFEAAGLEDTDSVLATLLEGVYHTYYQQYDVSGGIDDSEKGRGQDIDDLVSNYKTSVARLERAMADLDENSTVEEVHTVLTAFKNTASSSASSTNSSLVNATLLMAGVFAAANKRFTFDSDSIFRDKVEGVDPLTKQPFYQVVPGQSLDQSLANVFYGIFQNLNQTLIKLGDHLSSSNDDAKTKAEQAREYAANQKLICSTAANLDPVVPCDEFEKMLSASADKNGDSCSNQSTMLAQVSCTQAWYVRQQGLLSDARNAVTAINTAVSGDEKAVTAAQQKYVGQINSDAGSVADITTAYNSGVGVVNGAYAGLSNTISTNVTTVNDKLSEVDKDFFGSDITAIQGNLKVATTAAEKSFPAGLTADNVSTTYASSVPGVAIAALNSAKTALVDPINNAYSNAQALNTAVSDATSAVNTSKATALSNISDAALVALAHDARDAGITNINTDYTNAMGTNGTILQKLTAAQVSQKSLTALQKTHSHVADVGTTLDSVNKAVTAAGVAFPAGMPALTNDGVPSDYASTVPGEAVTALISGSSSRESDILWQALGIPALIVLIGGAGLAAYLYRTGKFSSKEDAQKAIEDGAEEGLLDAEGNFNEAPTDRPDGTVTSTDAKGNDVTAVTEDGVTSTTTVDSDGKTVDFSMELNPTKKAALEKALDRLADSGKTPAEVTPEEVSAAASDAGVADVAEAATFESGVSAFVKRGGFDSYRSPFDKIAIGKRKAKSKDPIGDAEEEVSAAASEAGTTEKGVLEAVEGNPEVLDADGTIDAEKLSAAVEDTSTGTGDTGFSTGSGGTGGDTGGDSVFEKLSGSTDVELKSQIQSQIAEDKLTKSAFHEQVEALQEKVDAAKENEDKLSAEEREQLANDEAQLDAAHEAEEDPATHFEPEL